jgi:2Fe-2S ferredoxin
MERTSMPVPASYNGVVPKVTFLDIGRTVEFESGKLPYHEHGKPESILDVALNFGIQLEHACGGSCACTTCHVHMKTGAEVNLSPMEEDELDRVETAGDLTLESRLGCQAIVKGDVVVKMPAWNRNYVSEGGGSLNLGDAIPPPKAPEAPEPPGQ